MSLSNSDSVSTQQLASAADPQLSVDSGTLPLYPSLDAKPSTFDLSEFFSRPVCLYTYSGLGTITTLPIETYATDYVSLQSVQEKLKYLKLVRGTFKIQLLLTVSPYAFGQFICAFYMGSPVSTGATTLDATLFNYWLSSKDKIILDCSNTTSGSIMVPMHIRYPYTDVAATLPDSELLELKMSLTTLTPILNAQDGTSSPFTIKVFVSLHSAETCVPTFEDTSYIYTSETQQAMDGPISYPATIVSKIGKALSNIPVIGPFAYATSLAADAVSNIAVLFGFSRPKDMSIINYPHEEDYSSYAGNLRIKGLTLDPLAEVPIDNSFLGDRGDNLSYSNTIEREGLLTIIPWSKSDLSQHVLTVISVTPCVCTGVAGVMSISPVGYVSQLFNLWRGTLRYRIVVPANRYMRGKIRFYWNPILISGDPDADQYIAITQNSTSVILDLSSSTEVTLEIPYAQAIPYQPVISIWADQMGGTVNSIGNGFLYMMVEEPLIVQASALVVPILVWLSAGADFEFAIPSTERMPYLRRQVFDPAFSSSVTNVDPGISVPVEYPNCAPMTSPLTSDTNYWTYTSEMNSNSMNPAISQTVVMLPTAFQSDVTKLHIGEAFVSLRNLLKRFYPNVSGDFIGYRSGFFFPYLPIEPFIYTNSSVNYQVDGMNTPLRYISSMFYGVRGSIRYRFNFPTLSEASQNTNEVTVRRDFQKLTTTYAYSTLVEEVDFTFTWIKALAGAGEVTYRVAHGEPMYVEIPYQCVGQYQPTTISMPPYTDLPPCYGVALWCQLPSVRDSCEAYVAAGEDFMPVIWNGIPLLSAFPPGNFPG